MEELELLKKDWKKDSENFKVYSSEEVYKMIRKKTISFSTMLFILGIIEITVWLLFDFIYGLDYKLIRYSLFICFIGVLGYTFYRIKNTTTSKELMKNILIMRFVVTTYVIVVFSTLIVECILNYNNMASRFYAGWLAGSKGGRYQTVEAVQPTLKIYILFFIILFLMLLIIYLFYKNFYGNILHKLRANYKELTKLEESNA